MNLTQYYLVLLVLLLSVTIYVYNLNEEMCLSYNKALG